MLKFNSLAVITASAMSLALLSGAASASTITIFSDDFNDEAQGTAQPQQLDNWDIDPGSVDVIGTGLFDFYPGNGNYLDMNGSSGAEGTITTKDGVLDLTVGQEYVLTFDYGTNDSPGTFPVNLTFGLGMQSQTLVIGSQPDELQTVTYSFTYDGTGSYLFFSDTSGTPSDNGGPVLDNVVLAAVIPLPAAGLLLITALGAAAALRRRKAVAA